MGTPRGRDIVVTLWRGKREGKKKKRSTCSTEFCGLRREKKECLLRILFGERGGRERPPIGKGEKGGKGSA